jgi:acyl carrier protein
MSVEDEIRAILRERNAVTDITPDTPLGSEGLALDSIAIVEVLLECEKHFGVVMAGDLLAGETLTVGHLIETTRALTGAQ